MRNKGLFFIVLLAAASCRADSLVANGTFDAGSSAGWTASPTSFNTPGYNECKSTGGNLGGFAILNDVPGIVPTMSQNIAGLQIGALYQLTWDMEDVYQFYASSTVPGAGASIDGNSWQFIVPNDQPWTSYSEEFTYTGSSSLLTFSAQLNGTDTDAGFDNIQLIALPVPEPSSRLLAAISLTIVCFASSSKIRRVLS